MTAFGAGLSAEKPILTVWSQLTGLKLGGKAKLVKAKPVTCAKLICCIQTKLAIRSKKCFIISDLYAYND